MIYTKNGQNLAKEKLNSYDKFCELKYLFGEPNNHTIN